MAAKDSSPISLAKDASLTSLTVSSGTTAKDSSPTSSGLHPEKGPGVQVGFACPVDINYNCNPGVYVK